MENKSSKQKGSSSSSSSSSIATDLFGPKATPPSTSVFGSVFGPSSTGRPMGSPHQGVNAHNKNANYQQETTHPCHYSSSIYYGGQDVYSTPAHKTDSHQYKKDGQDDGSDGSQGQGASRGNWWEGSLYY